MIQSNTNTILGTIGAELEILNTIINNTKDFESNRKFILTSVARVHSAVIAYEKYIREYNASP